MDKSGSILHGYNVIKLVEKRKIRIKVNRRFDVSNINFKIKIVYAWYIEMSINFNSNFSCKCFNK